MSTKTRLEMLESKVTALIAYVKSVELKKENDQREADLLMTTKKDEGVNNER